MGAPYPPGVTPGLARPARFSPVIPFGSLMFIKRPFRNPKVGRVSDSDLPVEPSGTVAESDLAGRYAAVTSRLDELEAVLRREIESERQRADQAEAQLAALGSLADHADEMVAQARQDARRLTLAAQREVEEARAEAARVRQATLDDLAARLPVPGPATGRVVDDELLEVIWDHLIDMGAVQRSMIAVTRDAVIRMMQVAGSAGPTGVVRPSPRSAGSDEDGRHDQDRAANQ
jgi:hypothetical protein